MKLLELNYAIINIHPFGGWTLHNVTIGHYTIKGVIAKENMFANMIRRPMKHWRLGTLV